MGGISRIVKSTPKIFKKVTPPTTAEVSQATSTNMYRPEDMSNDMSGIAPQDRSNARSGKAPVDMSNAELSLSNTKKKGRSKTILNTAGGLGSSSLNTTKKKLGA
jgi:hypothetical protein